MKYDIVPFVNDLRGRIIGFEDLFDDLVQRRNTFWSDLPTFPKDNIYKLENTIIIEIALAGYDKEDLSIVREGNQLRVSADGKDKEEIGEGEYVYRNIAARSFSKVYTVSHDYKDIRARFKNGILSIHLEKEPDPEEQKRVIEIS